jgi:hypothetical protein
MLMKAVGKSENASACQNSVFMLMKSVGNTMEIHRKYYGKRKLQRVLTGVFMLMEDWQI